MDKKFRIMALALILISQCAAAQYPNVIFILADDIGPGDLGSYDNLDGLGATSRIPTPNLDRLAAEGMRFTHAHSVATLCAPTRAGTMTGSNLWNVDVAWKMGRTSFRPGQKSVGSLMQDAGYRTAFVGKGHLGGSFVDRRNPDVVIPGNWIDVGHIDFDVPIKDGLQQHGFNYSLVLNSGIQGGPYLYFENGRPAIVGRNGEVVPISNTTVTTQVREWTEGEYNDGKTVITQSDWGAENYKTVSVPSQMVQKAVDFLEQHRSMNPEHPFFLFYSSVGAHIPYVPPRSLDVDLNGDDDVLDPGERTAIDGYDGSGPAPDDLGSDRMQMVSTVDAELGALVRYLESKDDPRNPGAKLLSNTIIFFTSDNGGCRSKKCDSYYGHSSVSGLREGKGSIYEGGHRVPFIVKWRGVIEEGAVRDQLIGTHDLMATLAGLTRQSTAGQAKDSFDLLPVLIGARDDADPVRDHLMVSALARRSGAPQNAYYEARWKMIVAGNKSADPGIMGLYDLSEDPAERVDVSSTTDPETVARKQAMYANYLSRRYADRSAPVLRTLGD